MIPYIVLCHVNFRFVCLCLVFYACLRERECVSLFLLYCVFMYNVSFCFPCWVWPLDTLGCFFQVIDRRSQFIQITILECGTFLFLKSQKAMVWIRKYLHTHLLWHVHTYTAQQDSRVLLTQQFFFRWAWISQETKCLSKTLSKQQEICDNPPPPKQTHTSPSLFINPSRCELIIYLWNFKALFE